MNLLSVFDEQDFWSETDGNTASLFISSRWRTFHPDMHRRYRTTNSVSTVLSTTCSVRLQDIALPFGQKSIPALWSLQGVVLYGSPLVVNAPHSPPFVSIK